MDPSSQFIQLKEVFIHRLIRSHDATFDVAELVDALPALQKLSLTFANGFHNVYVKGFGKNLHTLRIRNAPCITIIAPPPNITDVLDLHAIWLFNVSPGLQLHPCVSVTVACDHSALPHDGRTMHLPFLPNQAKHVTIVCPHIMWHNWQNVRGLVTASLHSDIVLFHRRSLPSTLQRMTIKADRALLRDYRGENILLDTHDDGDDSHYDHHHHLQVDIYIHGLPVYNLYDFLLM
jgi:hypothetical protein